MGLAAQGDLPDSAIDPTPGDAARFTSPRRWLGDEAAGDPTGIELARPC